MTILSRRLYRAVGLLGLGRLVFVAMGVTLIASVMIVGVRVVVRYREPGVFKEVMDTMGRRGREKKNEEGDNPYGADRTSIAKSFSHGVDNDL